MAQAIAFYTLAAFILGFAVMVVSTKDTVHSVLFLVLDFLFVAALYVLLGAPFLAAQTTTTLYGTVTDRSGAIVPGAQVTAKNLGTNLTRSAQTNMQARQISARGGELYCRALGNRVMLSGRAVLYLEGRIHV